MTRVVVAYATKMGSTKEIAEAIGDELATSGFDVEVSDAEDVQSLAGYDAAVIGSALYATRWLPAAVSLLERHERRGERIPLWLFQSGPCGDGARTLQLPAPRRVRRVAALLDAAPPVTFGGRLEPTTAKGFMARRMAFGKRAGDFREFGRIRRWARDLADQLRAGVRAPG